MERRTNVGDDSKKINKIFRVDEKFFPKKKQVVELRKNLKKELMKTLINF